MSLNDRVSRSELKVRQYVHDQTHVIQPYQTNNSDMSFPKTAVIQYVRVSRNSPPQKQNLDVVLFCLLFLPNMFSTLHGVGMSSIFPAKPRFGVVFLMHRPLSSPLQSPRCEGWHVRPSGPLAFQTFQEKLTESPLVCLHKFRGPGARLCTPVPACTKGSYRALGKCSKLVCWCVCRRRRCRLTRHTA